MTPAGRCVGANAGAIAIGFNFSDFFVAAVALTTCLAKERQAHADDIVATLAVANSGVAAVLRLRIS